MTSAQPTVKVTDNTAPARNRRAFEKLFTASSVQNQ
jgi:hypothetical protein